MSRRLILAVTAAALVSGATVAPAPALPVGVFSVPAAVGPITADAYGPSMAVLPDGTVGIAWSQALNTVQMAVRRPGTSAFTQLTPYTVPGGSLGSWSPPALWPLVTLRAAGSEFLLGWSETGPPGERVRVSRVSATATEIPAPVTVAGSSGALGVNPAFGTATDGSAVAAWVVPGPAGFEVRAARRPGTSGAWQGLGTAGVTTAPLDLTAAIDTSKSVTLGWVAVSGASVDVKVRSYQGSAWGITQVPGSVSTVLLGGARFVDSASHGAATTVAVLDGISGATQYSSDPRARGVRLMQRASSGAPWTLSSATTGPSRYALSPNVVMAPDGSAVVAYSDLSDGTTPATASSVATMVAQRRGATGALGGAVMVEAVTISTGQIGTILGGGLPPALAADGTLVMPLPAPVQGAGGVVLAGLSTAWRAGWSAPVTSQATLAGERPVSQLVAGMVIDPAGRATIAYTGDTTLFVRVSTTALPTPFVRSRAALSTNAPKVGTAVSCTSAWTGAVSLAYRWLRGGSTISGATAKTYTPKLADRNRSLSCRVTATNPTGQTVSTSIARTER